jgi:hypothetical protein
VRRPLAAVHLLALRDLRRDRTFSAVIILLSMLVTMLLATTVGGMLTNSQSHAQLYEQAESPDVFMRFTGEPDLDAELAEAAAVEGVTSVNRSTAVAVTTTVDGGDGSFSLTSADDLEAGIALGHQVASEGDIILPISSASSLGLEPGDTLTVETGVTEHMLTLVGTFEDPVFGSPMMGYKRAVVSEKTLTGILDEVRAVGGERALVTLVTLTIADGGPTSAEVLAELDWVSEADFAYDKAFLMRSFAIIPGIVSAVLLVTTLALAVILAFVLHHVSQVLIRREWRSSGVLKVLGLSTTQIRARLGLRMALLSGTGAALGALASIWTIPALGRVFLSVNALSSVSVVVRWPIAAAALLVVALVGIMTALTTRTLISLSPRAALADETSSRSASRSGPSLTALTAVPTGLALPFKDLVRAPGRFMSLIVTALAFAFLMGILIPLGTAFSTQERVVNLLGLDAYDVTALVITGSEDPASVFDEALDAAVEEAGLPAPSYVAAHRSVNLRVADQSVVSTVSTDFPSFLRIADGELPDADDEVLVAQGLARSLGVDVGDEIEVGYGTRVTYKVVGVYETVNQAGLTMWLSEGAYQRLEPTDPSPYFYVAFDKALDDAELAQVLDSLNARTGISATGGRGQIASVVSMIQLALQGVMVLVSVLAALLVGVVAALLAMSAAAVDRRTYAIMTILGFARRQLRRQLAGGFLLTAGAAALVGAGLAHILAQPLMGMLLGQVGLSSVPMSGRPGPMLLVCLCFALLCGAAAWLAAATLPRAASSEMSTE